MSMTVGPDGALWFTDINANAIGRIDPSSMTMRRYPLKRLATNPMGITVGPDGALWFAEEGYSEIGQISLDGEIREFGTPLGRIDPYTLAAGPDAALWFSASAEGLGRITTDGRVSLHTIPDTVNDVRGMVTGSDRNLWFISGWGYYRFSPQGGLAAFHLPDGVPRAIVSCPDGHLWMPSYGFVGTRETYRLYRVSTDGHAVEYRLPNPDPIQEATQPPPSPNPLRLRVVIACPGGRCEPPPPQESEFGIAGCFKNAVWFWIGANHVGRIDAKTGGIVEYELNSSRPTNNRQIDGRDIWYQDEGSGKLYEVAVP
jgi:streptogramin lyase